MRGGRSGRQGGKDGARGYHRREMAETLHATVRRIRFHKPETGFTVLLATRDDTREVVTIVGNCPLFDPDESIEARGNWKMDRRYGRQFDAESISAVVPTSRDGIERYLSAGHVKGIGPTLARRLLDHFGTELLQIMERDPERLREVAGIGSGTLQKIRESWGAQRGVRNLLVFLAEHGVGGARAFRIHKLYGDGAVSLIRENPYRLAAEIRGIGFHTADKMARGLGIDERSPDRVLAGLRHVVDEARGRGDCGIPVSEAIARGAELLRVPADLVGTAIRTALKGGEFIGEELDGRLVLFPPSLHHAETRIAMKLAAMAAERPPWPEVSAKKVSAMAADVAGFELDPEQIAAVQTVLRSKIAVITGGPGVGKTTIVDVILSILESMEVDVALAAPTGRAAKRLAESTGATAQTIHRLLEMSGESGGFQRGEDNPLEHDVVIIDETSMVDVPLADALLRALPEHAALVLVGDADQLPSIGPGQVLHDVIASGQIPSVRLTHIHRQAQASSIIVNAHRINSGRTPQFEGATDMFLFPAQNGEAAVRHVVELMSGKLHTRFGFDVRREVQVLSPMREGPAGVKALNETLQRALNPPEQHATRLERPNGVVLLPRDKVMQTENNYEKGVFNGDVGVLVAIDKERETFTVDFGAELIVDYGFDEADQLVLAYATTIHKSQGSEYRAVIVTLLREHHVMLQRNLLYTAVTRGREAVILVGDRMAIEQAVRTSRSGERVTRLRECLDGGTPVKNSS